VDVVVRSDGGDTLAFSPGRAAGVGRRTVGWTLEVVILPVSDVDRSIEFYRGKFGFELDRSNIAAVSGA
jgi:hypothetical protein